MKPVAIVGSGMVTGVGLTGPASCAAIRCGLSNVTETRFRDAGGEWIMGSAVPMEEPWRGRMKLLRLLSPALRECLVEMNAVPCDQVPLLLCVAEEDRPGRLAGLDASLLRDLQKELGVRFHQQSQVVTQGRVGGVVALQRAAQLLEDGRVPLALVAGVDSFLTSSTLAAYEQKGRLLTSKNSNGFIPGEAGAAVLLAPYRNAGDPTIACRGLGFGMEKAAVESDEPLRGDGLVAAIRAALGDARQTMANVDFRMADVNGEQYGFKEACLALGRLLRVRKEAFEFWHPSDCIGEVGAAIVPCVLGIARAAARKRYAPGKNALCHFANDAGERAVAILGTPERDGR
jgi:3-oxoacyl-[acyl-carrier-protein] synthase-1